jgi:alpha-mannosidase
MDDRLVSKKLEVLRELLVLEQEPLPEWRVRTARYHAPGDYGDLSDWRPLTDLSHFGVGITVFVEGRIELPRGWDRSTSFIDFRIEQLEGLLKVEGEPYSGVDLNHTRIPFPPLDVFTALLEFATVPGLPRISAEERRLKEGRFVEARLVRIAPHLQALWFDLDMLWKVSRPCHEDWLRRKLDEILEEHMLQIDLTRPPRDLETRAAALSLSIRESLDALGGSEGGPRILLTGHSHIDVAWLWPLSETVRKCSRTFSTACRLMERYPEYRFSCSQPQLYSYTKKHYPALYREIREWVKTGRWETTGGMWIESDCQVPAGETLIRQFLHGMAFFRKEFGTRPSTCWLPDVFGFPGNLPQIIRGCGHDAFFTTKIHWQRRTEFPHNLFWWEGIDGSRILAHTPVLDRNYNNRLTVEELLHATENYHQKTAYEEILLPYGYGDGGGGPTAEMLEYASRSANHPGLPATRHGLPREYFRDIYTAQPKLPVWHGELYIETHRGTFTSQAFVKRYTRKLESLFRALEVLNAQCSLVGQNPESIPGELWELFLLQHFHDIVPGSSITAVYADARRDCAHIETELALRLEVALASLSRGHGGVHIYNTLSWDHTAPVVVELPGLKAESVCAMRDLESGATTPLQPVAGESDRWVFVAHEVPPLGKAVYEPGDGTPSQPASVVVTAGKMENRYFSVELNERGEIVRLFDKLARREVVSAESPANRIHFFQDGPAREDAWNIYAEHEKGPYEDEEPTEIMVIEEGPVRGIVRRQHQFRKSLFVQDMIIYGEIPRIDFVTRVDWKERQTLVKAEFPLEIRSDFASFEVQFGAVRRPTHRNTPRDEEMFEVPAQRWADLSEAGYGVSVLNDCKYGYSVHGDRLSITLLRGTENPDPVADLGEHLFTYSLYPHKGSWTEGQTVRRGWELNSPLLAFVGDEDDGHETPLRALTVEGPAILSCLKAAAGEHEGFIARFYEPDGGRGEVTVRFERGIAGVAETNLIEEGDTPVTCKDGVFRFQMTPFAIRTFRIVLA